jgi:hypothetical protein
MSDLEYLKTELLERVDQLAIDSMLRAKIVWLLHNTLASEDVLNDSFRALDIAKAEPTANGLSELSMFDLGMRLNQLMVAGNDINIDYNRVVKEIKARESKLKDDPNLEYKKVR